MGIFDIFKRKKEKTTAEEEKELDVIKQIEAEVKKLEDQWVELEQKYSLYNYYSNKSILDPFDNTEFVDIPNKHIIKIWKEFIKINKRIIMIEQIISHKKQMERAKPTHIAYIKIRKLEKAIETDLSQVINALNKDIDGFISAIIENKLLERKIFLRNLHPIGKELIKGATEEEIVKFSDEHHKMLYCEDGTTAFNLSSYNMHKRLQFFDYLHHECNKLKDRLHQIR